MAVPVIIEGTWEDVEARAEQFRGKRVRLQVLTEAPDEVNGSSQPEPSLAEMLAGRTGLLSFEPSDLSRDTGKRFADLLAKDHAGGNR